MVELRVNERNVNASYTVMGSSKVTYSYGYFLFITLIVSLTGPDSSLNDPWR